MYKTETKHMHYENGVLVNRLIKWILSTDAPRHSPRLCKLVS